MVKIKEKSDQYFLEEASVKKAIAHLAIPMMLGASVGVIYNIINAFFLGLLNDTSMLSAVTFGLPVTALLLALGSIWGVGGGTLISRLFGSGEKEKLRKAGAMVIYGSLLFGMIVSLICIIFVGDITRLLGTDAMAFKATENYILFLFISGPFIVTNFAVEQIVRAEGAAKESMIGMFLNTAVNLALDVLLILVFRLNVVGAAVSFGLSNACSLAYYLLYLQKRSENISVSIRYFSLDSGILKEIFGVGVSDFLLTLCNLISALVLNIFAVRYGDEVIAAFGISLRIVQLPEFLCMGLFMGVIPLMAFSYGAKNQIRLRNTVKLTAIAIMLLVIVFSTIVFVFRGQIFALFTSNGSLINIGIYIISVLLISTSFNGFTGLISSYFQAIGAGGPAFAISAIRGVAIIPIIIISDKLFGLHGIIFAMPCAEFITFIIGVVLFLFNKKEINP